MDLALLNQLVSGGGALAQIAVAVYMWRLDRRVYRLELKVGVEQ